MPVALRRSVSGAFGALAEVFRQPDLRRLELAYVVSLLGLWGYSVAVAVYAYDVAASRWSAWWG